MAYTDLVERCIVPHLTAASIMRSENKNAVSVRGSWLEILSVLGHQDLLPPSDHQDLDLRHPTRVAGEVAGVPGWAELRTFLARPYTDDDQRIETLLLRIWCNDSATPTQQLARLSYGLRLLSKASRYTLDLNDPIYGFLRLAIARPVDWDYLMDLDIAEWDPFRRIFTTHMRSPADLALHAMRPQLGRLDAMLNQLVAKNQIDQAYSLTLRGLTALFFLHHCATMDRHRPMLSRGDQTALNTVIHDVWMLTMGLMQA